MADQSLKNKKIIISAGASGIGLTTSKICLSRGATVYLSDINEKFIKTPHFTKKIDIEIDAKDDYIEIIISDNGTGFENKDLTKILKPYFTTKKNGSGLGLPIVNKIINDHNGVLKILPNLTGAIIKINLPKDVH